MKSAITVLSLCQWTITQIRPGDQIKGLMPRQ